jgi:hypothetical protein
MTRHEQKNRDKYVFKVPQTMAEAKNRLDDATMGVLNVEKQLGDPRRSEEMGEHDYGRWRESAKSSRIFMIIEQRTLKEWIRERRQQLDAKKADIFPYDDPKAMLHRCIIEGAKFIKGEENQLEQVLAYAKEYLTHKA